MTDEVDTSVLQSDDSDTSNDLSLEQIEVSETDMEVEADDDSEQDESDELEDSSDEDEPDEEESQESDEEATDEETESSDEQARKEEARQQYERRQQEKEARERRIQEAQREYIAEASDSEDPLAAAVRQLQVDAYNNTVTNNQSKVTNDYQKALTDFSVLNTSDPVIQAEIDATIDAFQSQYVRVDHYGNPVEISGDLYATLQAKADSIEKLTGIRNKRQTENKTKEKSKAMTRPTRAPKEAKVDADIEAFRLEAGL